MNMGEFDKEHVGINLKIHADFICFTYAGSYLILILFCVIYRINKNDKLKFIDQKISLIYDFWLALLSFPNTLADRREHLSPTSKHT